MSSFARENETKEASFSLRIYIYIASSFAVGYMSASPVITHDDVSSSSSSFSVSARLLLSVF